ncbi:MAG: IS110 family transposase, partial [Actinomycetota bacterium]|nr:IS110 family transposase [Actinomycetota bacterium]
GKTNRHRLDRGGNRQLNTTIHRIALTRARCHPEPRTTSLASAPKARPDSKPCAASNATSFAASGTWRVSRSSWNLVTAVRFGE